MHWSDWLFISFVIVFILLKLVLEKKDFKDKYNLDEENARWEASICSSCRHMSTDLGIRRMVYCNDCLHYSNSADKSLYEEGD
jgi:hypothetical protein